MHNTTPDRRDGSPVRFAANPAPRAVGPLTRLYRALPPILHQPAFVVRRRLARGKAWHEGPGRQHRDVLRSQRVLQGPFEGTILVDDRGDRRLPSAKILGTYECELNSAIDRLVAREPEQVVVVGAAEGLYALGLARRLPDARHRAYEGLSIWRWRARRNARRNGIEDRVELAGFCDPEALRADLERTARSLVVCDCEGYEHVLLDPAAIPGLRGADILVELHPMFVDEIEATITSRFRATHHIERVTQRERTVADLPAELRNMDEATALDAMRETRQGETPFLIMTPFETHA